MDTFSSKRLREKRANLVSQMHELVTTAGKEDRELTAEEAAQFDRISEDVGNFGDDATGLAKEIQRIERLDEVQSELRAQQDLMDRADHVPNLRTADDTKPNWRDARNCWRAWAIQGHLGMEGMPTEMPTDLRESVSKCGFDLRSRGMSVPLMERAPKDLRELRDEARELITRNTTLAQTLTTSGGGDIVANAAMLGIEVGLLAFGGMREAATVLRTENGATMPMPTLNDTTAVSTIIAINTATDVKSLVFGQATLSAFRYSTGIVLTPRELLQDANFDVPSIVSEAFGVRAGRGTNLHFTVGVTTDTQPSGAVTDSIEGSTGSDVNTVTYAELVTLEHSVDRAYRQDPSARFMFSDTTLAVIKKLLDGDSRPLWQAGVAVGEPDRLLGYPYIVNNDMASIAATTAGTGAAKAALFGAFSRYVIRDVSTLDVLILSERYAELGQTGFIGYHRHDGITRQASTVSAPIKHFVTKST